MNALTNMKNIKKLSEEELKGKNRTSWHEQYRSSAWVFIGGLPFDLTEGDIICVFSQYGELVNINLVRDKETGKSKGFCFICYEDQRSTDLAVDNLNGIKILGRTVRVDHVANYKPPKNSKDEEMKMIPKVHKGTLKKTKFNVEDGFSKNKVFQDYHELNRCKKKKKEKSGSRDFSYDRENESKNKIKNRNFESLNPESSSSSSASTSSSSSSSSSPSSLSSSSSEEKEEAEKLKSTKNEKGQRQRKNRIIEDLKREARLIQAELKRRQQTEEPTKTSFLEFDEKHHSRKKSRSESNENRYKNSKIRQEKIKSFEREYDCKKEKKRNRFSIATSRVRRRSRTPERHRYV